MLCSRQLKIAVVKQKQFSTKDAYTVKKHQFLRKILYVVDFQQLTTFIKKA